MKEVTTKVLGNEPDLLVSTGCRSKLNAGTDDEMTITGYRLVRYDDELSYYLVWFGLVTQMINIYLNMENQGQGNPFRVSMFKIQDLYLVFCFSLCSFIMKCK